LRLTAAERRIVFLIGAVNFINVLDFMIVMPLGPDFALALGIPTSHIGFIAGSYSAAGCVAGLIASSFLDRFGRRRALAVCMAGLVVGTALGGLAFDLTTLLLARVVAGAFGGPAIAVAQAIIADTVAPERRGRAMGAVTSAFSLAAVLGVPIGLELAERGGWRLPLFSVAALGVVIIVASIALLPPIRGHLRDADRHGAATLIDLPSRRRLWIAYALGGLPFFSIFLIIPNISAYVQTNLGFPRAQLDLLYLIGGGLSFFGTRLTGRIVDRIGATPVTVAATLLLTIVILLCFVTRVPSLPVIAIFPLFMLVSSCRFVATSATLTKVPAAAERAGFISLLSAIQNFASTAGSFVAAQMLAVRSDGALENMAAVALLSITVGLAIPVLMWSVERSIRQQAPVLQT
jgi:predicted MFS family arabinose efflux permease